MYVICDPMETLANAYWFRSSYVDALKIFFSRTDVKEAIVFRDIFGKGRLQDLQFLCTVKRKNLDKLFSTLPRA